MKNATNLAVAPENKAPVLDIPKKKHPLLHCLKRDFILYLMLLLPLLFYFVFHYVTMGGILIAFKDFNIFKGIIDSDWAGLEIFRDIFKWKEFYRALSNTIVLNVLGLILGFPAPIILALLLNEVMNLKVKRVIQTVLYLPHFFSWIIVGGMMYTLFATNSGVVNRVLGKIGLGPFPFLTDNVWWVATYLISGIWKGAGWGAIIYLAAITGVDMQLYEAAKLDGCSKWQAMWKITIPCIRPTISIMLILRVGQMLNIGFDQPFMMGNSMVREVSEVISTFVYRIGLIGGDFNHGTAIGLSKAVVSLILIQLSNRISKKMGDGGIW